MSQSHTATEQWQSFELRMRRRRFDRCVLRAAAALDAEFLEAAKEAIEEAERLSFEDPDVAELKARLQVLEALEGAALHPGSAIPDTPAHPGIPGHAAEPVPVPAPAPVEPVLTPRATAAVAAPAVQTPVAVQAPVAVPAPARAGRAGPRLAAAAALVLAASVAGWAIFAFDLSSRVQPALMAAMNWLAAQRTALSTSVSAPAPKVPLPPEDVPRTAAAPPMATEPVPDIAVAAPPPAADPAAGDAVTTEPSRAASTAGTAGSTAAPPAAATPPLERSAPLVSALAREVVTGRPADAIAARTPESRAAPPAPAPAAVPPPVRVAAGADSLAARTAPVPLPSVPVNTALALPALPAAPAPSPAPSPAPPADASPSPAAAAAANERLVRATLTRYEAAYSGLDAAAARAVWPSVDHRALARAFDGLESQRFSLERCNVRLNGGSAQADCSGSAQWTPKVGGGAQTASRRWQFELKRSNGDWVIVRASVR